MNDFVDLRRVIATVARRWWLLVGLAAIGAMIGYVVSRAQTPVYQAMTTVLVGESIKSPSIDRVDIQISDALVQTYIEVVRRQQVMQGVVTTLNLSESWQDLKKQVTVARVENTQLIEISVEAGSPEMARKIADEVANQLLLVSPTSLANLKKNSPTDIFNRDRLASLQEKIVNGQKRLDEIEIAMKNSVSDVELASLQTEKTTLEGLIIEWERNYTQLLPLTVADTEKDPNRLSIIENAHANNVPIRPRIKLSTVLGGAIGLLLALGSIFLLDFLDDTYKSLNDFTYSEQLNILGSIRRIKGKKYSDKVIADLYPYSPITESYRMIRSRIRFRPADRPIRSMMVTSPTSEEGKSLTVANLAAVFAQAHLKTVIVDADLRDPVLHKTFGVKNEVGLGDLLSSPEIKVEECLQDTSVDNLQMLSSGKPVLDPSERLGSERMAEIIMDLKRIADVVIFDSPPALAFADAIVLSNQVDGVIVVVRAGKSKRDAVNQTLVDLQNANAHVLGSIFNEAPGSDTFAVNKVHMQERLQLALSEASIKKENVGSVQPHDLYRSTVPLTEELEIAGLDNGANGTNAKDAKKANHKKPTGFHELADSTMPANRNYETPGVDKKNIGVDETLADDVTDSAMPADEKFEMRDLDVEQAGVDEISSREMTNSPAPEAENLEMSDVDVEQTSFDETLVDDVTDSAMPVDENLQLSHMNADEIGVDEALIQEMADSDVSTDESLDSSDLGVEKPDVDELRGQELTDSAVSTDENLAIVGVDNDAKAAKKARRRRKRAQD